jgi:hypothetical protein
MELVKNLSNKQKAVLYFSLICEGNELETDRLISSIEWHEYKCLDMEFQKWHDSIFSAMCVFGMMYWREIAQGLRSIIIKEEADTAEMKSIQRLAALQAAMVEFCNQHGMNIEDVWDFIGNNWPTPLPDAIGIDHEYQKKVLNKLNAAMPVA